jgi:hypothetical protein
VWPLQEANTYSGNTTSKFVTGASGTSISILDADFERSKWNWSR